MLRNTTTGFRVAAGALVAAGLALAGTTAKAADFKWPRYFNVVTPIVGSANHSLAVAWTPEFSNDTGVRVRVLPTSTGYARAEWLTTNQGRLSLYQASDYFDQMDASEGYATRTAGPADTRVIYMNLVTPWGYMVRGDSDIKTFSDLKSSTSVSFYTGSTFISNGMRAGLAMAGLTEDQIKKVEVGGYAGNTKVVVEGRADITFTSPLSGTSYEADANPNGIRWLAVDTGNPKFAAYRKLQAGYVLTKTAVGPKSALGITMDHAFQTNHVRADEDPEFVYQLVKWLDENHDKFKEKFVHAKMMSLDNMVAFLEAGHLQPLHEGLIRYLKEKNLWKDAYQKRQDGLLALANKRIETFQAALDAAGDAKIMTDSPNDKWKAFLADAYKNAGITKSFSEEVAELN